MSAIQSTGKSLDRAADNAEIKQVMKLDYEECGLSKEQMADILQVPANTITDWLAPSKPQFCIPVRKMNAWMTATGSDRLAKLFLTVALRRWVAIGQAVETCWQAEERLAALRKGAA